MKSYAKYLWIAAAILPLVASQAAIGGSDASIKPIDSLSSNAPAQAITTTPTDDEASKSYQSFIMAITMISASEIGDKTFLIAAIMAMRHSRWLVFTAAASSLAIMTVLSGLAGHSFVAFMPEYAAKFLASILFFVFGYKLLQEGLSMAKDAGVEEELAEVEEELAAEDMNNTNGDIEAGGKPAAPKSALKKATGEIYNLASLIFSPLWIQIFVMNFLAEFGDRSQISIIALASDSNYWSVIAGAVIGHCICTGAAVVGGMLLAGKISMRTVTLAGSVCFFIFGFLYLADGFASCESI